MIRYAKFGNTYANMYLKKQGTWEILQHLTQTAEKLLTKSFRYKIMPSVVYGYEAWDRGAFQKRIWALKSKSS